MIKANKMESINLLNENIVFISKLTFTLRELHVMLKSKFERFIQ